MRDIRVVVVKCLRHINWALVDQIVISAFNFSVSLVMIKLWTPEEFGTYAFIFAVAIFSAGLQNALVTTPMSVLRVYFGTDREKELIDCLWTVNFLLIISLVAVLFAVNFVGNLTPTKNAFLLVVYNSAYLIREYMRGYLFSSLSVERVLFADVAQVALAVCGGVAAYFLNFPLSLTLVIVLISLSYLLPAIFILLRDGELSLSFRKLSRLKIYNEVWQGSRWSLLGVFTTELQNRSYLYLVTVIYGAAALGLLQAARIPFAPIGLIVAAWGRVARVQLAGHFASGRDQRAQRILLVSGTSLGAGALVYIGVIWFIWPRINMALFIDKYPGIASIAVLWALVTLISLIRGVPSISLQALNEFKRLSFTTLAGAGVSILSLVVIVQMGDYRMVLLSVVFGDVVAFLLILWGLHNVFSHKAGLATGDKSSPSPKI